MTTLQVHLLREVSARCLIRVLVDLRHEVLQLAIVFMCGVNQLSPGAYLLRKDLSLAIVAVRLRRLHLRGWLIPRL